ncbi:MAG: acyltransferase [Acidobacteria bacterium]|jgi:acetyltransferase-like isoleucine patch superfamily enzyme|nr:acyltransferase [Acidobacteriota bacterium]
MTETLARWRGALFRLRCALLRPHLRIGPGLRLFCRLDVRGPGRVTIGSDCSVRGVPGDRALFVTIYTHEPDATVVIGDHARLYGMRISCKFGVTIGDAVLIEESSIADTDFHAIDQLDAPPRDESRDRSPIVIGNRVSIGARSFVTKGTSVGDEVVVVPGSIVRGHVPAGAVVMGNPARVIRS